MNCSSWTHAFNAVTDIPNSLIWEMVETLGSRAYLEDACHCRHSFGDYTGFSAAAFSLLPDLQKMASHHRILCLTMSRNTVVRHNAQCPLKLGGNIE